LRGSSRQLAWTYFLRAIWRLVVIDYNRYRNRSSPQPNGTLTKFSNGSSSRDSIVLPPALSEQCYDTVTRDFRKRQAAGEIFNNAYLDVQTSWIFGESEALFYNVKDTAGQIIYSEGYQLANYRTQSLRNAGKLGAPTVVLDTSEAERNAQINALASVNKTEFDASLFAAEWSKTKNLLRDILNALDGVVFGGVRARTRKARFEKIPLYDVRGNPVLNRSGKPVYRYAHDKGSTKFSGSNPATRMANAYLVGRYGVMPLLKDLEDAVKALAGTFNERNTARGASTVQAQASRTERVDSGIYGSYDVVITSTRTFDARYGILYESDPYTRALAKLGLTRPLSTAWELLPWSFVADWVFQVGKYLDAIQPAGFTKTLSAWGSTRDTTVVTYVPTRWYPYGSPEPRSTASWTWSGSVLQTTVVKNRFPWDAVAPTRPGLGSGLSTLRSADLVALMLQKMKARF